jgi:transposase InsO family protein
MIDPPQRQTILDLVDTAVRDGARLERACDVIGISARCLQRWRSDATAEQVDRRSTRVQAPKNALSDAERQAILATANHPDYADLPPTQIVPILADQGRYLASESSFYRVLRHAGQLAHRRPERPARSLSKPRARTACRPNQIVCWDISYLPTDVRGQYFYLYLILDLYSRCIVAWQVHDVEHQDLASALMRDYALEHDIQPEQVVLHADNGAVMKGSSLYLTLRELGIVPSHSRPAVSNDNPYVESTFRTLKYRPDLKIRPFENLDAARSWVSRVVDWYNTEHRHSGIRYVTPRQRHAGEDVALLRQRAQVYADAKVRHPGRWSGNSRNWQPIEEVHLNPEKASVKTTKAAAPKKTESTPTTTR